MLYRFQHNTDDQICLSLCEKLDQWAKGYYECKVWSKTSVLSMK